MEASLSRNSKGGEFDTRDRRCGRRSYARKEPSLLGYASHAAYQLEDQTAQTCRL